MTTNQTIDGVPRELATLLLRSLNGGSDTLTGLEHAQAYKELRALLDAPVDPDRMIGGMQTCAVRPMVHDPKPMCMHDFESNACRKCGAIGGSYYLNIFPSADAAAQVLLERPRNYWPTRYEQPTPVAVVLPDLWQPIETAPKDGTEIILRKGDRVTSGAWIEWTKSEAEFHSTGAYLGNYEYDSGASWSSWDGGFCDDDHPTHWQPLPTVTPQQ